VEVGHSSAPHIGLATGHQREFETVGKLREIAGERGKAVPKLAIAWILATPAITSAIHGASRTEQPTDTVAAADYSLEPELKVKLDDLSVEYRRGYASEEEGIARNARPQRDHPRPVRGVIRTDL
jgi:aryl-alcohol dehydrogenase-like predicted oxidoreductase